jgi:hypothetical protein
MPGQNFTIGNVAFNKMYLGDKLVYFDINDGQETYVKSSLQNYFNANIEATTSSWGDTLSNTGSIFTNSASSSAIRYIENLPSSSYYDFSGSATLAQSMFFGRAPIPSSQSRTVLLWIKPANVGDDLQMIQYIGMAPSTNNALMIQSGGLAYRPAAPLPASPAIQGNLPSMSLDTWYQVGYTFDQLTSTVTLFQNEYTSSFTSTATYNNNLYWEIGELSSEVRYSGSISIQMIYTQPLSHQQILQNYEYFGQFYN